MEEARRLLTLGVVAKGLSSGASERRGQEENLGGDYVLTCAGVVLVGETLVVRLQ
jgi:hypothetical protein